MSYVGTGFHGWQSQPSGNTIQDHVEKALSTFLRQDTKVVAGSRTDSGVHAEHQVISFKSDISFEVHRLLKGCNALLPQPIKLHYIEKVADDFHPILSSKGKLYRYRIWKQNSVSPFMEPYCWIVRNLDCKILSSSSLDLVGLHNFKSFCAKDGSSKTFERNILDIKIVDTDHYLELYVLGEGFLKQMVRNMVGTLVEIGLGKRDAGCIPSILLEQRREAAGRTAPAEGLSLVKTYFDKIPKRINLDEIRPELVGFRII